ncbi:hypothetical protein THRCLA_21268 [Thraustotheca clavata]|uniref:Transmembrane protein n=1 Tax=Thraustotheca clavata TaxID=74557 RepID=A0A1V9ZYY9_9STRA|nr:hypothetical protein THRCLA_21268 [Thraustotheca clavata]
MATAAFKSISSLRSIGQEATNLDSLKSTAASKVASALPRQRGIPQVSSGEGVCANFALFVMGLFGAAPFILVPVFVCLKLDGDVTWSWGTTLIPLWICDALVLPYLVIRNMAPVKHHSGANEETPLVAEGKGEVSEDATATENCFVHTTRNIALAAYLLAQIFVVVRLDHVVDWHWLIVLIPYYVASILSCEGFDLIQALLIAGKMDGFLDESWTMTLLPSLIGIAMILVFVPLQTYWAYKPSPDDEDAEPKSRVFRFFLALGLFFALLFLVSPGAIAIYRLDYAVFSTFYIALPFFILVGVAILTGLVSVFTFTSKPQQSVIYVDDTV